MNNIPTSTHKVTIVNRSDSLGGAAVVSFRLMNALREIGVDARMLVVHSTTGSPHVAVAGNALSRKYAFLAERLKIYLNNGRNRADLFKIDIANTGIDITRHPWVQQADTVCLNWVNQGFVSLPTVERLVKSGKRIIWTMHDMWNATGVCHHAGECRNYLQRCGNCPFTRLAASVWEKKRRLYADTDITFVAVSRWLADLCRESSLLRNADIRVIPNAFPIDQFGFTKTFEGGPTVVFGAARIDDPIKGLDIAIDALNIVHSQMPEVKALFFGDIRQPEMLHRLAMPHTHIGRQSPLGVQLAYRRSDVVLSTSLYETLPGTVIEGMAAGCTPVTFDSGGQTDIFDNGVSGFIAEYKNPESVADCVINALRDPLPRQSLHDEVARRFSAKSVAQRYLSLFNE